MITVSFEKSEYQEGIRSRQRAEKANKRRRLSWFKEKRQMLIT